MNEVSDADLAERVRAGDADAYRQLWERHSGAGHTAARSFSTLADADDLVSEAFLQILSLLRRGGGPREAFRPYLYRTIRNLALNRRQANAQVSLEVVGDIVSDSPDPETTVMENTVAARAFHALPERWQTALWYLEVEGMQPAEAAPILGLTPNGVAALAYRAREGLRKAWLQAHVNHARVPAGCVWTTERMSEYVRGDLTASALHRFEQHVRTCTRCSALIEELDDLGSRLASVLLPLVLGGAATASLLAGATSVSPAAQAVPVPAIVRPSATALSHAAVPRHGVLVAAAVIGVLALGSIAMAANGVFGTDTTVADSAPSDAAAPEPTPSRAPAPEPEPTTPPQPSPPPTAPPVNAPPPESDPPPRTPPAPAPEPDVTAPVPSVIQTPLDGALRNNPRPEIAGTGEPLAQVEIERVSGPGYAGVILAAPVDGDGHWRVVPEAAFADGDHTLRVTQVDAAGNRSAPVELTLRIDTVALPPTLEPVTGAQRYLPTLLGTAEPFASVLIKRSDGMALGTTKAEADGAWSFALPDSGPADLVITAAQIDPAGNQSETSAPQAIQLLRPEFSVPNPGAEIPSSGGATVVEVRFGGIPGYTVEVLIDGVPTGNIHTLGQDPLIRSTPPLADGSHTIAVRYKDSDTGAVGSLAPLTFTIG